MPRVLPLGDVGEPTGAVVQRAGAVVWVLGRREDHGAEKRLAAARPMCRRSSAVDEDVAEGGGNGDSPKRLVASMRPSDAPSESTSCAAVPPSSEYLRLRPVPTFQLFILSLGSSVVCRSRHRRSMCLWV